MYHIHDSTSNGQPSMFRMGVHGTFVPRQPPILTGLRNLRPPYNIGLPAERSE